MTKDFYDRADEMSKLSHMLESLKSGEFVLMYGRRRVGKTELIKQFLARADVKKVYFYIDLIEKPGLMKSISDEILGQLGDYVKIERWDDFFEYLHQKSATNKLVVVLDEFQRFLDISPDFITRLQHFWDEKLKNDKLMLVIVGSSIGMMLKIAQGATAPLYGRVTSRMKVSPFRYVDFREMFHSLSEEEKIKYYAVFGGTPFYLNKLKDAEGDLYDRISSLVLVRSGKLYEEPAILMDSENIRIHARYNSILQAISGGKEIIKEINDITQIRSTTLPAYMSRLDELLDLIYRCPPVLGKEKSSRYKIRDNFFNFWYRFVFPNQSTINLGNVKAVENNIRENLDSHIGRIFENVVIELLTIYSNRRINGIDIDFDEIGGWWDRKSNEIDIVAYSRKRKAALLGEVKWTNEKMNADVVEDLLRKAGLIDFKGRFDFLFVSKSGFTAACRDKMESIHATYLGISDIEKLFEEA